MHIEKAGEDDVTALAGLLWWMAFGEQPAQLAVADFAVELAQWWTAHRDSHTVFVARLSDTELAGMAWVSLLSRPPRPGATSRLGADLQSVFVTPEHRGQGIGSALVAAACDHAARAGADSDGPVQSARGALYEHLASSPLESCCSDGLVPRIRAALLRTDPPR